MPSTASPFATWSVVWRTQEPVDIATSIAHSISTHVCLTKYGIPYFAKFLIGINKKMLTVVGIQLSEYDMPKYFDPNSLSLKPKDFCVVEYNRHEEVGFVVSVEPYCPVSPHCSGLPKVLRLATEQEIEEWRALKKRELDALNTCRQKVKEHGLTMKITNVRFDTHNNKVIFHFTADKRVDFRELVKDLGRTLRSRIELWQIGVRDEAKLLDGFGICGRRLCCAGFIREFVPVSIRMAKDQDIILSPTKLSGVCGRLMCCLAYEEELYRELSRDAVPLGASVRTKSCEGVVVDRSLLHGSYSVQDQGGTIHTATRDEIEDVKIPENLEKKQKELKHIKAEEFQEGDSYPPDDVEC
jgi:cell fate regulator YaaT (PSP1 superfamily)